MPDINQVDIIATKVRMKAWCRIPGVRDAGSDERAKLLDQIEAACGVLNIPYHLIETEDLIKIYEATI